MFFMDGKLELYPTLELCQYGKKFLFGHSSILFNPKGSVITAIAFMVWRHFGHINGRVS